RRASDAEKVLDHTKLFVEVLLPERLAIGGSDTGQSPIDAVGIDSLPINHRRAARTIVVLIKILVLRRHLVSPQLLARLRTKTVQPRLVAEAIELKQPAARNR